MLKQLRMEFIQLFGGSKEEIRMFFAPGRVNLIGEHTDYNGGHVFPCALNVGTYAIARQRKDKLVKMYSKNFAATNMKEFHLEHLIYDEEDDWANYPKGVMKIVMDRGYSITNGLDILFYGNIPDGAGLSSSAAIELVTVFLLKEFFGYSIDGIEMARISQQAENQFIGVNCGIMDQFAVSMGKKDRAILLDCRTLSFSYSSIKLENAVLVIANTNKRRGLTDSKYNERRKECERALEEMQVKLDIESLGDLSLEQLNEHRYLITNELDFKRARHAVSENVRTIEAIHRLQLGDIHAFGQLMNASHISLRDDYGVTGKELDTLVEAAWEETGVVGARMTGAGFGGCTVNIVKKGYLDSFMKNVGKKYKEKTGLQADFYTVEVGDGVRELKVESSKA